MQASKIDVMRWDLPRLVTSIHEGKLRIPDFQRAWVWERRKVVALLDSIYREFPIGSFFFWRAPTIYNKYFRDIAGLRLPPPRLSEEVLFILDGQQRITSLYVVSHARQLVARHEQAPDASPEMLDKLRQYVDICFDLDDCVFRLRRGDDARYIPFCDLMDEDRYDLEDALTAEQRKALRQCRMRFKNYPFSVIVVEDKTLDDVCDIFKRINQGGKRLSLSDLIIASTWSTDFNLREKLQSDVNRWLQDSTFGSIEPEIITETLAIYLRGTSTQAAQLDLLIDEVEAAWPIVTSAIFTAISFFYGALGVKTYDWLPYRAMMPLLAYFFCKVPDEHLTDAQRSGLITWFWRSAIGGRYGQAATSLMARDRADVMDALLAGQPFTLPTRTASASDLLKLRIERQSALKNAVFCLLALNAPRDFIDDRLIPMNADVLTPTSKANRRIVFSRQFLKGAHKSDLVLNALLIPAGLHAVMIGKPPAEYLADFADANPDLDQTLASHILPVGADSPLRKNDYPAFLRQRADLMVAQLHTLAALAG